MPSVCPPESSNELRKSQLLVLKTKSKICLSEPSSKLLPSVPINLELCRKLFHKKYYPVAKETNFLHIATERCCLGLETAKCCHVFGLLAGNAPVISLMDSLVMFPGGFVVDWKSLDWFSGQCLKMNGIKVKTFRSPKDLLQLVRKKPVLTQNQSPGCRWLHRFHNPPGSRASSRPESSARTVER